LFIVSVSQGESIHHLSAGKTLTSSAAGFDGLNAGCCVAVVVETLVGLVIDGAAEMAGVADALQAQSNDAIRIKAIITILMTTTSCFYYFLFIPTTKCGLLSFKRCYFYIFTSFFILR
jgi:hypothetical protein